MYFLNINKPKGLSSFDVIRELRKKLKIKQIGHSGTLDPLASGVLQIAVGKATKLLDYLNGDKTYIAKILFGYNSTTYDEEGEKTFVKKPNFTKEELKKALKSFIGKTKQKPPIYSAIKVNGKKLCDEIRKDPNQKIEVKERDIEIYSIDLIDFANDIATIEVSCKKGTYIRSLAFDLGEKLACGAYIKELQRTKAGNFKIESSNSLNDEKFKKINPLDCLDLEKIEITDEEYGKISNGNFISNKTSKREGEILLIKDNKLVSIAKIDDNYIKPKKFFKE